MGGENYEWPMGIYQTVGPVQGQMNALHTFLTRGVRKVILWHSAHSYLFRLTSMRRLGNWVC